MFRKFLFCGVVSFILLFAFLAFFEFKIGAQGKRTKKVIMEVNKFVKIVDSEGKVIKKIELKNEEKIYELDKETLKLAKKRNLDTEKTKVKKYINQGAIISGNEKYFAINEYIAERLHTNDETYLKDNWESFAEPYYTKIKTVYMDVNARILWERTDCSVEMISYEGNKIICMSGGGVDSIEPEKLVVLDKNNHTLIVFLALGIYPEKITKNEKFVFAWITEKDTYGKYGVQDYFILIDIDNKIAKKTKMHLSLRSEVKLYENGEASINNKKIIFDSQEKVK